MDIIENINLAHRPFLTGRFHEMKLNLSDYTFANIYLFRNEYRYRVVTRDCGTFISAYNRENQNYVMPLGSPEACTPETLSGLLDGGNFFFPIPEEWLAHFPEDRFHVSFDEADSDYVYRTAGMASFSGKQFTRHRNHLNQFLGAYRPADQPLGGQNLKDAAVVLDCWQDESRTSPGKTDFAVCREALDKYQELALTGTIYYIDHQPAGLIIGEALNAEMFCLHFAKASKKYHGIYEFMFNDMARKLEPQYKYLNLEEDMGNKNLRKTKSSYGPERILKKYRVSLKTEDT